MQLEEQFFEPALARWKRSLPWLRIFRGFRMALDFRKLVLAFIGVMLSAAGYATLMSLPFAPQTQTEDAAAWSQAFRWHATADGIDAVPLMTALENPLSLLASGFFQVRPLLRPWRDVVAPAAMILQPNNTWSTTAWAWTLLLWALLVWGVFGVAISRIAALELTGAGTPSLSAGFRHALRLLPSTLGGPLLPVIAVFLFWAIPAVIGLIGHIPGVGPILLWVLWPVVIVCTALLALILIGVAASWPLMYCTISVEGTDAFDAMSRAYSYVFGRPWYALWIAVVTLIYGSAVAVFLFSAAAFALSLTGWAVGSGLGQTQLLSLSLLPGSMISPTLNDPTRLESWTVFFVVALLTAYIYSYFWTAMTTAYLLLRHGVDATPLNALQGEAATMGLALGGAAAADQREAQSSAPADPFETPPIDA